MPNEERSKTTKDRPARRKTPAAAKLVRRRTVADRPLACVDTRRTVGTARGFSPLARLIHALGAEGIRFLVIEMSGAILQGVPATTLDTDLWIDLPARSYMRINNIALTQGGSMVANTVVELRDRKSVV